MTGKEILKKVRRKSSPDENQETELQDVVETPKKRKGNAEALKKAREAKAKNKANKKQ